MNGLAPTRRTNYYPATGYGRAGLNDSPNWVAALAGIYQTYQASAQQAQANDAAVDYLREQVYIALQDIRFAIRHGGISPGQALSAGQQVIAAYYSQTATLPAAARARAESYRPTFVQYAALNQSEADWFYQKWDCPDITTQAQIGVPRCTPLSATATPAGTGSPGGVATGGTGAGLSPAAPAANPSATDSILNLLGTIDVLGLSIPILPVAAIGLIFLLRK